MKYTQCCIFKLWRDLYSTELFAFRKNRTYIQFMWECFDASTCLMALPLNVGSHVTLQRGRQFYNIGVLLCLERQNDLKCMVNKLTLENIKASRHLQLFTLMMFENYSRRDTPRGAMSSHHNYKIPSKKSSSEA